MALLLSPLSYLPSRSSSPPLLPFPIAATLSSGILRRSLVLQPRSLNSVKVPTPFSLGERRALIVRASAEAEGKDGSGVEKPSLDGTEAPAVSIENLPLESKERLKLEQKLRMKLAKKIRLRRKRLVTKRHLRKKGRWPPSKMRKNKNV